MPTNGRRAPVTEFPANGGRASVRDVTDTAGLTTDNGDAGRAEPAGPLERRRAAALEARRTSRQLLGGAGQALPSVGGDGAEAPPRVPQDATEPPDAAVPERAAAAAVPERVPAAATEEPAPRRAVTRAVAGMRRPGVLALVAGVLVVLVVGIAGLVALRNRATDERPAPAPEPEGDRREQPATVRPLWTTPVADGRVRSLAVTEEAVVVAAGTTVGALDPTSGAQLWTRRAPARVADVAVVGGVVSVRTGDGVTGYDVAAGTPRWTLSGAELGASAGPAAVVAGGRSLYTAVRDDTDIVLSAVDPADGVVTPLTTISGAEPGGRRARLALAFTGANDRVGATLYALTPAALYAVDVDGGAVRWQAPVRDGGPGGSPALEARPWVDSLGVAAGAAFVVDRDGRICRHAAASGELVWTTCPTFPAELEAAPTLLVGGGRIVVASDDTIATFDFTTGLPQWHETTRNPAQSAVAGGDALLYMARPDAVIALEHGSGHERWRAPGVEGVTMLAADADGVFAGLADGSVVRLVQRTVAQADVQ
jgi:outer membrane protein assembly factor BamB